jgi:hypothetical protein
MMRRHVLSHDDQARHDYKDVNMVMRTPRKWRTYEYSTAYQPSVMHAGSLVYSAKSGDPAFDWVGKKIVYWNGDSVWDYARQLQSLYDPSDPNGERRGKINKDANVVYEYDIAKFCRPNIYRFIYIDENGKFLSKPETSYRPGRMNLLIDRQDIIRGVQYF